MGRISRSWALVKASWAVLRADKELLLFPVVSTVLTLAVAALFALPLLASGAVDRWSAEGVSVVDLLIAFVLYLVVSAVVIFCNAALVGAADIRLRGGDPTLRDGFRIAFSHVSAIVGWALVTATVGTVLRAVADRGGAIGTIVSAIAWVAWALALLGGALSGIFTVALYRYATSGDAGPFFPRETIEGAIQRR